MKKILFAASECVPFIKTGGLADVCGALPKEFDKSEWDIRVVLPFYECIDQKYKERCEYVTHFYMTAGSYIRDKYVGVMQCELDGIRYYFIDNQEYFGGSLPYGDIRYDIEKFVFFDKAVLSMLPQVGFQPDLIHCHDWQTGLIPVYLKNEFQADMFFWGMKSMMTIHNLKFQGVWDVKTMMGLTGFDRSLFASDKLEFNKDANMLKGGLVYADYITTVSDTYASEIQTPYYGEGLDGLLKARHFDMQGIVNGIDYKAYDPATDDKIYTNYNITNFRKKKADNKEKLQQELGLAVDKKKFMIGLISRLTDQKGLDLINYVIDRIADEFTQFVVIGTGESSYENMFRHYAWKYGDRISANICYSDALAHKLYAAADAFLMPSRFEPCGLTQLISFRYGTVPIVRETGGLKDTVQAYNEYEHTGDGFSFTNYNGEEMLGIINYAKHVYFDNKREWNKIAERGMACDYSWNTSKKKYEDLYNFLL
ncbi:MAG: glycogen synthase GlgA [Lachnospiraceae bacterium]|nr:glycogen synthase GlgA [Lachnospiraceae bacterium]